MQLASGSHIPDGLLAANALLAENSRQGSRTYSGTLHQGFGVAISSTALGIIGPLYDGDVRSRSTGKERDSESGNDYFGARYYGSSMGRFMSPDPLGGHLEDPQTLDKYSYVANNPPSRTDPTGLDFNLTGCGATNATNCQNNMLGSYDSNNVFTATRISSGANGLQDQNGNSYNGTVTSSGVSFSQSGGTAYSGQWINRSNDTSFTQSGGALNGFSFNFTQPGATQSLAGTFSFKGSPGDATNALGNAGFSHSMIDQFLNPLHGFGVDHYRGGGDPITGEGSAHYIIDLEPWIPAGFNWNTPDSTEGHFHYGEIDPRINFTGHMNEDVLPYLKSIVPH